MQMDILITNIVGPPSRFRKVRLGETAVDPVAGNGQKVR